MTRKIKLHHDLFLTRKQRFSLLSGSTIVVRGRFAKIDQHGFDRLIASYRLVPISGITRSINFTSDTFTIPITTKKVHRPKHEFTRSEWLSFPQERREYFYTRTSSQPPFEGLRDEEQDGSQSFSFEVKTLHKKPDNMVEIHHFVFVRSYRLVTKTVAEFIG